MTFTVVWHTLSPPALAIVVGYLFGRWQHHRRLDRVELDAWLAGYRAGLKRFSILGPDDDLDRVADQLDEAETQTGPPPAPWWN